MKSLRLALIATASLALLAPAASTAGVQTFWRDKDNARPEPARITLAGGSALLRMNELRPWGDWGQSTAEARGRYRYNTCRPYCGAGDIRWTGVDVQLRDPHPCHGQRRYSVIEWDPDKRGFTPTTARVNCEGDIVHVS